MIWGRNGQKAEETAAEARALGLNAVAVSDLATAAGEADIISCATLSREPLIRGEWLRPGTHLDLVGAFKPEMRESDDEAVRRSAIFVDTREGAMKEGGDIVQPIRSGVIQKSDIRAEMVDLIKGTHPGRKAPQEITLFKSVGAAVEDLAGAILAYRYATGQAKGK